MGINVNTLQSREIGSRHTGKLCPETQRHFERLDAWNLQNICQVDRMKGFYSIYSSSLAPMDSTSSDTTYWLHENHMRSLGDRAHMIAIFSRHPSGTGKSTETHKPRATSSFGRPTLCHWATCTIGFGLKPPYKSGYHPARLTRAACGTRIVGRLHAS
jgi:hypothetical protein